MSAKELRMKIEVAIEKTMIERNSQKIEQYEELWRRAYEVKFVKDNKRLVQEVEEVYSFVTFG